MATYDKRKRSIYLTPPLQNALGAMPEGVSLTGRLTTIADRYAEMLERTRIERKFTPEEWDVLRAALQGVIHEPAAMIRGLVVGVRDYLDDVDEPREDGDLSDLHRSLLEKLETLSYHEEVAIVEAVEQWWRRQR